MRALKFRAWFSEKPAWCNQMFYSDEEGGIESLGDFFSECVIEDNDVVFMQDTGLTDKHGQEIFEGDIVQHGDALEKPFVVEYGVQHVDAFEGVGFNLWGFIGEYQNKDCARLSSEIEVIGNIYENPDLIETL